MSLPEGPREWVAQIVGLFAIALYFLSYQQKDREKIIAWNATSRVLYILQYILLLSFDGAVLDVLGIVASLLAGRKDRGFIGRHKLLFFLLSSGAMIVAPIALPYLIPSMAKPDLFTAFAIIGVLFHTGAFWLSSEKIIRRLSLAGSPFWLVFNFSQKAYPSAIGDALTIGSILLAMLRYDLKRKKRKKK